MSPISQNNSRRCAVFARVGPLVMLFALAGCMHPPMGPGYMSPGYAAPGYAAPGYQQPMYAPPGTMNAPGTLVVPPSNAPLYSPSPGSTYEKEKDTFQSPGTGNSGNSQFYPDDAVPDPQDPGTGNKTFDGDLEAPKSGVNFIPQSAAARPELA